MQVVLFSPKARQWSARAKDQRLRWRKPDQIGVKRPNELRKVLSRRRTCSLQGLWR